MATIGDTADNTQLVVWSGTHQQAPVALIQDVPDHRDDPDVDRRADTAPLQGLVPDAEV
ncbi:hypothetical protein AB0P15_31185 [Streptomyces sp. NPDC087917]|uniref:hypothetical protein n=1 Tax=Streptomyces sp. NPDC087917 TaxID=3155060 RepID=UPI0034225972